MFPGVTYGGRAAVFSTSGNPDCHVVLRGTTSGPNYDESTVTATLERLRRAGLPAHLLVDASHGNSGKDHRRQPVVAAEVARRVAGGDRGIVGLMLESFLVEGRQELELGHASKLVYGQSITDACMGWDTTVEVLGVLAGAVASRRHGAALVDPADAPADRAVATRAAPAVSAARGGADRIPSVAEQDPEASIVGLRREVDHIDAGIVRLLAERAAAIAGIAAAKGQRAANIRDLDREQVVLDQVEVAAEILGVPGHFVRPIFETIVEQSVALQNALRTPTDHPPQLTSGSHQG